MDETHHLLEQILAELRCRHDGANPVREIMSLPEAAEYLRQSEYTVREWTRLRKVPFHKVNGNIKFRKSRLDRWIDRNEVAVRE